MFSLSRAVLHQPLAHGGAVHRPVRVLRARPAKRRAARATDVHFARRADARRGGFDGALAPGRDAPFEFWVIVHERTPRERLKLHSRLRRERRARFVRKKRLRHARRAPYARTARVETRRAVVHLRREVPGPTTLAEVVSAPAVRSVRTRTHSREPLETHLARLVRRRVVVVVHRAIRRRPPQARLRARVRLVREPRVVQVVHVPLVRAEQGRRGLRGYLQHRGDPRHGVPLALAHLRRVEAPKRHRGRLVLARGDVAERLLVQDQILVRVRAGHRVEVVRRVVFIVARVGVAHRAAPARALLDWRPDLVHEKQQQRVSPSATRVRHAFGVSFSKERGTCVEVARRVVPRAHSCARGTRAVDSTRCPSTSSTRTRPRPGAAAPRSAPTAKRVRARQLHRLRDRRRVRRNASRVPRSKPD